MAKLSMKMTHTNFGTIDTEGSIYKENPEAECYHWPEGRIPWEGVNC